MAKALIILHDGYTDSEAIYAYDRCKEEDIDVHVATVTGNDPVGEKGWDRIKANFRTTTVRDILYDILILPGGVKSIEKVRQDEAVIEIIRRHYVAHKVIGSMCHGAQLLIEAGLVRGREIAGYYSIKTDIINAGGKFIDGVAQWDNIISASHYKFNGKFMQVLLQRFRWNEKYASEK